MITSRQSRWRNLIHGLAIFCETSVLIKLSALYLRINKIDSDNSVNIYLVFKLSSTMSAASFACHYIDIARKMARRGLMRQVLFWAI